MRCEACGKPIEDGMIFHHVLYEPVEIVVPVHGGCHFAIHQRGLYPHLFPIVPRGWWLPQDYLEHLNTIREREAAQ